MSNKNIEKAYEAASYEDKIYAAWEKSGFFNPDNLPGDREGVFSLVLPPPNVTGTLHMGHAVMLAIEDIMTRFARMRGKKTLWVPGTDHAAIATQTKVEKLLMKDGMSDPRGELGRDEFLRRVDAFASDSHDTIVNQSKKMGASMDWSREAFTLDDARNKAVNKVFEMMYQDGLIYQGDRIVNWCPRCKSTLADDEVEYKEHHGKFYYFKYGPVTIGTARPETKFLDKVIVVHPEDDRYKGLVGKELDVEWIEGTIKATMIADDVADMEMGSGAMTITPAHSFVDFDLAKKYGFSVTKIINEDGVLTDAAGSFAGMDAREAREKIVDILDKKGLVESIDENYIHNLSVCYRCESPIEPLPKIQWFIDVNKPFRFRASKQFGIAGIEDGQEVTLKSLMQHVVREGQIEIIPDRFTKTYFHWIDNLRDWNISRQIWYGHRVPVWNKVFKDPVSISYFRHGTSEGDAKKIVSGHLDHALTDLGRVEIEELKPDVDTDSFDIVFTSDLSRAIESAKILFGDDVKIISDERLREINFGDFEGKSVDTISVSKETFDECRVVGFPGGETYEDVRDRVVDFLLENEELIAGKKIAIVAHSGTRKVLDSIINGVQMDQKHLSSFTPRKEFSYTLRSLKCVGSVPEGENWEQDNDTLDTWFSSGLWTFSTLGWPDENKDLETFHPTSMLETGYDIIFFWVARMILMTTYVLGQVPFKQVYLHGLVRDETGRKMSKSLGNVIDPLDMISKYGADATRLSLVIGTTPGNDSKLSEQKISGYRNFTNKLWNISRFVFTSADDVKNVSENDLSPQTHADRWILHRFQSVANEVTSHLEKHEFSQAGERLRDFTWNEFADWYLEIAKIQRENDQKESTDAILLFVLRNLLAYWHPFMPFVTEALWENFPSKDLLVIESWETPKKFDFHEIEDEFDSIRETIVSIRNVRSQYKVDAKKEISVSIWVPDEAHAALISSQVDVIQKLARAGELDILREDKPTDGVISTIVGSMQVFVSLADMVDPKRESERLSKEISEIEKYLKSVSSKLENNDFRSKAPDHVVESMAKKKDEAEQKIIALRQQLKMFE